MQPLGSPELVAAYHARIAGSHDYTVTAEILDTAQNVIGPARLIDGQVNLLPDATVHRTATATLLDPDRSLGLDGDSIFAGSAAANRLLRIRHTVYVPGYGDVTCTPFVGGFTRINRNGATIDVEAQDKTGLVMYGSKPYRVPRGMSAMPAIKAILEDCTGEAFFRLPTGVRFKLRRPYSVGWADESSPWKRATEIAHAAGMQILYSCDGYVTVRPYSTHPVLAFGVDGVPSTAVPAADVDLSQIVNYARVEADKIVVSQNQDHIDSTHPFSPTSMGRNGVPRYLPSIAELSGPGDRPTSPYGHHRKVSKAEASQYAQDLEEWDAKVRSTRAQANTTAISMLRAGLTEHINLSWSCAPVFHLDYSDPIRIVTDEGSATLRITSASIPLLPSAEGMTIGLVKSVSRPGRIRG